MQPKLAALKERLDLFIVKQQTQPPQNDPLHQLQSLPSYEKFELLFTAAITLQATWTAAQLSKLGEQYISVNAALTLAQVQALQTFLDNYMPKVADSITQPEVDKWFTQSFSFGAETVNNTHKAAVNFNLVNPSYKSLISSAANTLLTKSKLDDTTRQRLVEIITQDKEAGMTNQEVTEHIKSEFKDKIAPARAKMIARTETANMMNQGQFGALKEAGMMTKSWMALDATPCPICLANEADGRIPIDAPFSSGDLMPTAHPNCECSLDYFSGVIKEAWTGN